MASFDVYDDLYSYASGVYVRSTTAKLIGAHAVTMIGWGEASQQFMGQPCRADSNRGPYLSKHFMVFMSRIM